VPAGQGGDASPVSAGPASISGVSSAMASCPTSSRWASRWATANRLLEKLGECVIVFSEVTLSSHRRPDFRKFEEAAERHREIVEWYNVSGGYDYLLKIVAPSVAYFQELMERLLQDDVGIEKFSSRIVLRQASGKRTYPLSLIAAAKSGSDLPCA
jgi:DNA-binding Lrp family transcriptional regulator